MNNEELYQELARLKFEDFLCVVIIILSIINMNGDYNEREYLLENNVKYKEKANNEFELTITISFFIYIYFVARNYKAYKKASSEQKNLYLIKLFGSSLFVAGAIFLLYFQTKQKSFIGTPAL